MKKIANLVSEFRKQFIKEDLPNFLYHYTSIKAFKSIIDNKEIWATAANYLLNDPTEMTHAEKIALETLQKRKNDFSGKNELYDKCKTIIEGGDDIKEYLFVFSFTEEEDLLSQWRGYCPKGGISIGFSVPKISENNQYLEIKNGSYYNNYYVHENYLYKCIYKEEEQRLKINQLFDFLLERTEDTRKLNGFFNKMLQTFSYSFKHESFGEESEWRLVCFLFTDDDQLKYRVKDSMLIPYLPFLIIDHNNESIISKIMIGPSRDKEKLRKCISSYLRDSRISASVKVTDTPYQPL